MTSVARETYYVVGNKQWPALYLTLEHVKEALAKAGAEIIVVQQEPASMEHIQILL